MQTNCIFIASNFVIHPQILIFSVCCSPYWLQLKFSIVTVLLLVYICDQFVPPDIRHSRRHCSVYQQSAFNSKANDSAAQTAGIHNQDSNLQNAVRRGWNVAAAPVSKRHTLHSISTGSSSLSTGHQSDKLAAAVHSQTAKLCSGYRWNAAVHTSKQQPENNDVGEVTVKQSDPEELTPKLPAELIRAGWKLCWSKQRSRWYVFNIRTGTSSWDVPK